jgi:GTPase SAR1 family protein
MIISHITNTFPANYIPFVRMRLLRLPTIVFKCTLAACYSTHHCQDQELGEYVRTSSLGDRRFVPAAGFTFIRRTFGFIGQDDYARLRPISYLQADLFLICFRVTWSTSFESIRDKWYPEMRHYCPDVPFLIVATQTDLRDCPEMIKKFAGQNQRLISTEEGERLAYELRAAKYVECSSLTRKRLDDVFHEVCSSLRSSPMLTRLQRLLSHPSTRGRCTSPSLSEESNVSFSRQWSRWHGTTLPST